MPDALRVLLLLTALAAPALPACGSGDDPPAGERESLRIALVQAVDALPLYVMADRGFARREGLELTETDAEGGAHAIELMAGGQADVANTGVVPAAAAAADGTVPDDVVGIVSLSYADPQHRFAAVVVPRDVRSFADLRNRRIAVNVPTSLGAVAIEQRLREEGVRSAGLAEVPFPNMGLAVRTGDVGAAVMFEPYITQSLERGDGHVLAWVIGGAPMERVLASLVAARTDLLRHRPEVVRRFLRAYLAAIGWIRSHEADARRVLARRLAVSEEVAADLELPRFASDGAFDDRQMERVMNITTDVLGGRSLPPSRLYDDGPLGEVAGR